MFNLNSENDSRFNAYQSRNQEFINQLVIIDYFHFFDQNIIFTI
jgi:hypothetical protein